MGDEARCIVVRVVDLTGVQSTAIKSIRFNDFFLPSTFRVSTIRLPRRLQSDEIQRRPGVLQQETYDNVRRINIVGQVYSGQAALNVAERLPRGLAFDGTDLWMLGETNGLLYRVDPETGVAVRIPTSGAPDAFNVSETLPQGLAFDGMDLYMVGATTRALYQLARTTGIATQVGTATSFGVGETAPRGLAWDGTSMFMVGATNRVLYRVSRTTGMASRIGTATDFGVNESNPRGLASDGTHLYMLGGSTRALYRLDKTTGVATRIGRADEFTVRARDPQGLAWRNGALLMVDAATRALYQLDLTTGAATQVGTATDFDTANELSADELIDEISRAINTSEDGWLFLKPDRFYYARLRSSNREYVEGSNRNVANMTYEFLASNPYEYAHVIDQSILVDVTVTEQDVMMNNMGNTSTPVKLVCTFAGSVSGVRSIRLNFYDQPTDTEPASVMIVDSLGQKTNDASHYWAANETITFDSENQTLAHTRSDGTVVSVLDFVRNSNEFTAYPVRTLPIEIKPGITRVGLQVTEPTDTGRVRAVFSYRGRWI